MTLAINNAQHEGAQVDLVVEDGFVKAIVPHGEKPGFDVSPVEVIDATGLAVFPAMANMHSHSPMTLFRGLGEDKPLDSWLNDYIWPAEQKLTDQLVYEGTLRACQEMAQSGTAFFNDMYFRLPSMAKAVEESGLKARLGYTLFGDADDLDRPEVIDWLGGKSERVLRAVAPHAIYTVSERGLRRAVEACKAFNLPMHIHMSETQKEVDNCLKMHGCRPWQWLDRIGVLDEMGGNIIAAHCLHLSDDEIKLIGSHGITVVHCPNSNLKLGSGLCFKMRELQEAGAHVTLGTDGSASSNNLDMIEVAKVAALLQKGWRNDPTAAPVEQMLDMATLGRKIAVDSPADLFLIKLNTTHEDGRYAKSDLIYATHGDQVKLTMVDGKVVYRGKKSA